MNTPAKRRTVICIVRVWAEYLNEPSPNWRGIIEMAGSGQQIHFSQLDEIAEIIRRQTILQINTEDKL